MWGLNAGLVETLSLVLRTHVFTSTVQYFHNDVNFVNLLYYQEQGNWLVSPIILVSPFLATELPCYIADLRADDNCKPQIFLGKPQGSI